ncbi:MAG: DUF1080 domain-containing protein [Cytophagales bacterium]|nr:DUF1080 domain-containing protein [Cytophagales bacterium]
MKYSIAIFFTLTCTIAVSQFVPVSMNDLSAFSQSTANWTVAGSVSSDYTKSQDISITNGTGILVNKPIQGKNDDIFTKFEHGDMELEFEFMMPKNSNSGIYLMGRYEVQLYDSWAKSTFTHSDCGGIYEQWNEALPDGQKGYNGVAPLSCPMKIPGTWNKMKIVFEAPIFKNGKKIKDAVIISVTLNDKIVQQNINLPGPTRGAISDNEVERAPLRIQGDHGPIAIKNMNYFLFDKSVKIEVSNVKYKYYEQKFDQKFNIWDFKPLKTGETPKIDIGFLEKTDGYAIEYFANITLPNSGIYNFELEMNGRGILAVDGDTLVKANNGYVTRTFVDKHVKVIGTKNLNKGTHTVYAAHWKNWSWLNPGFGILISGQGLKKQGINSASALPPASKPLQLEILTSPDIKVYRTFVKHRGKILTHAASVGMPTSVNFTVNPLNFSLIQCWRGHFLNMSEAWIDRGGREVQTLGTPMIFANKPSLAVLETEAQSWPDTINPKNVTFKGYYTESSNVRFSYNMEAKSVNDVYTTADNGLGIKREITVGNDKSKYYCLINESDNIIKINDIKYYDETLGCYIILEAGAKALLRNSPGGKQLILPLAVSGNQSKASYSIIW